MKTDLGFVRQPLEGRGVVVDVQNVDVDAGAVPQPDDAVVGHDGFQGDVVLSSGLDESLAVEIAQRFDESALWIDGEIRLRRADREGQLGVAADVVVGGRQPADVRIGRLVLRNVEREGLVGELWCVVVLVDDVDDDRNGGTPRRSAAILGHHA